MMPELDQLVFVLTLIAALGCGLVGGVFFAFSAFIMRALARLPASHGIAAMQAINVAVLNRRFLGTAVLCVGTLSAAIYRWPGAEAICLLAGSTLYLAGSFLVTMVCNVPRNESLTALAADAPGSTAFWTRYLSDWTARFAASISNEYLRTPRFFASLHQARRPARRLTLKWMPRPRAPE